MKDMTPTAAPDAYVRRANDEERIARIIVTAGCKPYAAAAALLDAGYVIGARDA